MKNVLNNFELTRLVSSFVIGDGSLLQNTTNARYSMGQISTHKDYVDFQASVLEQVTPVSVKLYPAYVDKNGVGHKEVYRIETRSHPFFTTLRQRNYFQGRKTVSLHDVKNFDWQSLAIWYMDDGYILRASDKSQRGAVFLCTDNFSHAEVLMLQKIVYEKFGLPFNLRKRNNFYRLTLIPKNAGKFLEGIEPFVFPSFQYKLHTNGSLAEARDGDIV